MKLISSLTVLGLVSIGVATIAFVTNVAALPLTAVPACIFLGLILASDYQARPRYARLGSAVGKRELMPLAA